MEITDPETIRLINEIMPPSERPWLDDDVEYWLVEFHGYEYIMAPFKPAVSAVNAFAPTEFIDRTLCRSEMKFAQTERGSFYYTWKRQELPERCYIWNVGGALLLAPALAS